MTPSSSRNVVICGQEPLRALAAPPHYSIWLSADPAYRKWATPAVVAAFRNQGRRVYAWCDCWATLPEEAIRLAADLGLDGWAGEAERTDAFDNALAAGATVLVGNANAWTQAQRTWAIGLITTGRLALIQETYTNVAGPWPENTGTQGVPVASFCLGVYDGADDNPGGGRYISIGEYREHTPAWAWPHVSVFHAAGVRDAAEWDALYVPVPVEEPVKEEAPVASTFPRHVAVMRWAKGELGVVETPPGSNTGKRVRFYQAHTWLGGTGWPWCAAFVATAWEVGGKRKLPFPSAGAWDMGDRARKAGWAVARPQLLRPGDIVTFRTGAGHVALFVSYDVKKGLIRTLDGNVDNSVAYATRRISDVRDLIRVPEKPIAVPGRLARPPLFEVVTSEDGEKVIYVSGARAVGRKLEQILRRHPHVTIRRRP